MGHKHSSILLAFDILFLLKLSSSTFPSARWRCLTMFAIYRRCPIFMRTQSCCMPSPSSMSCRCYGTVEYSTVISSRQISSWILLGKCFLETSGPSQRRKTKRLSRPIFTSLKRCRVNHLAKGAGRFGCRDVSFHPCSNATRLICN